MLRREWNGYCFNVREGGTTSTTTNHTINRLCVVVCGRSDSTEMSRSNKQTGRQFSQGEWSEASTVRCSICAQSYLHQPGPVVCEKSITRKKRTVGNID